MPHTGHHRKSPKLPPATIFGCFSLFWIQTDCNRSRLVPSRPPFVIGHLPRFHAAPWQFKPSPEIAQQPPKPPSPLLPMPPLSHCPSLLHLLTMSSILLLPAISTIVTDLRGSLSHLLLPCLCPSPSNQGLLHPSEDATASHRVLPLLLHHWPSSHDRCPPPLRPTAMSSPPMPRCCRRCQLHHAHHHPFRQGDRMVATPLLLSIDRRPLLAKARSLPPSAIADVTLTLLNLRRDPWLPSWKPLAGPPSPPWPPIHLPHTMSAALCPSIIVILMLTANTATPYLLSSPS